ncbi:hypothetical protein LA6_003442 [Marinibacterium anthonyi]|nr:hypothetical protein LA6_003442 [Marinibacterium anthonyi]
MTCLPRPEPQTIAPGDTFRVRLWVPFDLTQISVTSQVRRRGVEADLAVRKILPRHVEISGEKALTITWPLGRLRWDIRFENEVSGEVWRTPPSHVDVLPAMTRPAEEE